MIWDIIEVLLWYSVYVAIGYFVSVVFDIMMMVHDKHYHGMEHCQMAAGMFLIWPVFLIMIICKGGCDVARKVLTPLFVKTDTFKELVIKVIKEKKD
jgi:hypothetical protein